MSYQQLTECKGYRIAALIARDLQKSPESSMLITPRFANVRDAVIETLKPCTAQGIPDQIMTRHLAAPDRPVLCCESSQ